MSITTVMIIVCVVLILAIVVFSLLAFWDWRAWMVKKVGLNYKRGLAHIKVNGVWTYRESTLIYEGHDAMSYSREMVIDGVKEIVTDIVPNKIGFTPDEYTGDRVYRVQPGGCIGCSDDGDAPTVDYPARLISAHVLGRTASQFASSVTSDNAFNWKPLLIIGTVIIVVAIGVFAYFTFMKPGQTATPEPEKTEQTTPVEHELPAPIKGESQND